MTPPTPKRRNRNPITKKGRKDHEQKSVDHLFLAAQGRQLRYPLQRVRGMMMAYTTRKMFDGAVDNTKSLAEAKKRGERIK